MMPIQQPRAISFFRRNWGIFAGFSIVLLGLGFFIAPMIAVEKFHDNFVPLMASIILSVIITGFGAWLTVNQIRECLSLMSIGELHDIDNYTRIEPTVLPAASPTTPAGYVSIQLAPPPISRSSIRSGARTP